MQTPLRLTALALAASLSLSPAWAQSPLSLEQPAVSAYPLPIDRGAAQFR
jgi:hypothetical protein